MPYEKICPGCAGISQKKGDYCTWCGWNLNLTQSKEHYLPFRTSIGDRYYTGRVLGQGGFGITYIAHDRLTGERVAVKEYMPQGFATRQSGSLQIKLLDSPSLTEQYELGLVKFAEESRKLLAFQHHPGVVKYVDFIESNGTAYLVMEYLEGMNLKQYLQRKGDIIKLDELAAIFEPVMQALIYLHQSGLLHRDISPDNIFICEDKTVKLLDFGSARQAVSENSLSLSVIIKHGFAPFEQYSRRGKQGPWTDVYGLSATIYKCLTGRTPPDAPDRLEEDPLIPPSQINREVGTELDRVIMKGLANHRSDRYQDIYEFRNAVAAAILAERPGLTLRLTEMFPADADNNATQAMLPDPGQVTAFNWQIGQTMAPSRGKSTRARKSGVRYRTERTLWLRAVLVVGILMLGGGLIVLTQGNGMLAGLLESANQSASVNGLAGFESRTAALEQTAPVVTLPSDTDAYNYSNNTYTEPQVKTTEKTTEPGTGTVNQPTSGNTSGNEGNNPGNDDIIQDTNPGDDLTPW